MVETTEENDPALQFEQEYQEACKKINCKPMATLKFGHPLPPLPLKSSQLLTTSLDSQGKILSSSSSDSKKNIQYKKEAAAVSEDNFPHTLWTDSTPAINTLKTHQNVRKVVNDRREGAIHEFLKKGQMDFGSVANILLGTPWNIGVTPYDSRFRFTPTIDLECIDSEEDEELLYKIQIRGFWNNRLSDHQFNTICNISLSSNLRQLSIDNNPSVSDILWATLCGEESYVKNISLRGNCITDVGAKALAHALKTNRMLVSLNLFDNKIQKSGAEALGEALKGNSTLQALSLGKNNLGDDGLFLLTAGLYNIPLTNEEVLQRKKLITEVDRLKNDVEEDPTGKKKAGRRGLSSAGRTAAADKDDKKKAANAKGTAGAAKKLEAPKPSRIPDDPKAKKITPSSKKGAAPSTAKGKKGKTEDAKEEMDDIAEIANSFEPMFEVNNQWYILGNRTLNSLNVASNGITEAGVRHLLQLIADQEHVSDQTPEGLLGLFRVIMNYNAFPQDLPLFQQLQAQLSLRNPFFEPIDENENSVNGDADGTDFNVDGENDQQDDEN